MPDVFDELEATAGDIFDQAAGGAAGAPGDVFERAAESARLDAEMRDVRRQAGADAGVLKQFDEATGLASKARSGVKRLLELPTTIQAAGVADLDKPTIGQERRAFTRAMSDPAYFAASTIPGATPLQVESRFGPPAKLEMAMAPQRELQKAITEDVAKIEADLSALPRSEAQKRLEAATSTGQKWTAWLQDPIELTAGIVLESLPASLVGAGVGGVAGGAAGMAAGVGASSAAMTFASELLGNAAALGYDVRDPERLQAWLNNSEDFQAAFRAAAVKSAVVGGVDAGTAGIAGQFIEPALKQGLKQIVIAGSKEAGVQMAGGAGGEALGALAAGQEPDLFDVAMEGIAEIASAPGEIAGNLQAKREDVSISSPSNELEKSDTPKPAVTRDLAAELQAALQGNQLKQKAEPLKTEIADPAISETPATVKQAQPRGDVFDRAMEDLPADTRAEIEARLKAQSETTPVIPLPAGKQPLTDDELKPDAREDLRAEGVTAENIEALLAGTKTAQQVVDDQLGIKRQAGSIDANTIIVEENADGSRSIGFAPEAGPASTTPVNVGQMSHVDAIQMAREQGIERITQILGSQKIEQRLTAEAQGETTIPGAAAGTVTGQNEGKASEVPAGDIAAEPMPAEVLPAATQSGNARTPTAPVTETAETLQAAPTSPSPRRNPAGNFYLRPRSDGVADILDGIQELGGIKPPGEFSGGEYDGFREAMTGPARMLINRNSKHSPDTLIQELKAIGAVGAERLESANDLWPAVQAAVKGRDKLRITERGQREEAKQSVEFDKRAVQGVRPKKDQGKFTAVPAKALLEGDEFEVMGIKFEVKHLQFEPDGSLSFVEVKDGPKFGVQRVDGDEFIHVDNQSFAAGPEHDATPASIPPAAQAKAAKPDAVLDALDKLKVDTRGTVQAFGLLPEAWNTLIDLVKLGVRAGRSLRDAVGWAIEKFKARNPNAKLDEAGATEYLLTSEEAAPLREQFVEERDKGLITDERANLDAEKLTTAASTTPATAAVAAKPQPRIAQDLPAQIAEAEAELKAAIRQFMTPPEGMGKREAREARDAAAARLRDLQRQRLQEMMSIHVDQLRGDPAELARHISETVDLLNAALEDISQLKAESKAVPSTLNKFRNDLQTRLMVLKGWSDDQTDEAATAGARQRGGPAAGSVQKMKEQEFEGATNPDRKTLSDWWNDSVRPWLRKFASPVPEIPLTGPEAVRAAPFLRGFRLFRAETERVRREAAAKIGHVLEPLLAGEDAGAPGRTREQNQALKRYMQLSNQLTRARVQGRDDLAARISADMTKLEDEALKADPFNLFRLIVLYRDLWWRVSYLKTENGKPITLPQGFTLDDVVAKLRRLTAAMDAHPQKAAIAEALRRHYALTDELQKSILDHGEIIPEALRNPLYFPHHILDNWTGRIDRVRPSTEEDFRKYLIAPRGSGKLVQTDYLKAMYVHTADVLAHNARVDLVQKYWQRYDISERLKEEHGEAWDKPWNLPPGYKLFSPFKKLPLRMDYVLTREVLADKLGVLFNDGDLRSRAGEAGRVLKVKPEDLHAAMVAGERIKWAVPVEIAEALEGIAKRERARANPGLGHEAAWPVRKLVNFWKKTKLFAPWNWIRYEYGNTLTDVIDKVLVADPGVAKFIPQAAREIIAASRAGEKSPEFIAASREGVFETITGAELGDARKLTSLPEFKELATGGENAREQVAGFARLTARMSMFREATFRYAKFLADVDRMRNGRLPVYAGAYHESIEALGEDPDGQRPLLQGDDLLHAKAAEISLKTFGDYNSLSVVGQWLRQYLIPFHSWTEVNFKYHANQLRNIADGVRGIRGGTQRDVALRYAAVRVVSMLAGVAIAQALWNSVGGAMLGLWDDDDDLESQLSAHDRRRAHLILGKDENGKVLVAYTPSAFGDVAEWIGGNNGKRLFLEYAKGDITLQQFISDYAKQLPADTLNKLVQSTGPALKSPYELASSKAVFPDVLDQRTIPRSERWWRFMGGMTDDRAVGWLRQVFDKDYYAPGANEQLQQIILQVRRRDPEQWSYYEAREKAADWKEEKTGKRFEAGSYDAPEAQALRNFRRAIYRADVAAAEHFYERLLEFGYTSERFDASIRAQHPLSDLNRAQQREYSAGLDARSRRELDLALAYYDRIAAFDRRERGLFPRARAVERGAVRQPNKELLRQLMRDESVSQ